jgi:DNA-binding CsgD family transcriptional regulator
MFNPPHCRSAPTLTTPVRLYRVQSDCRNPRCTHRYRYWVTEQQRTAALKRPETELFGVQVCPVQRCGDDVPILVRHVRDAAFDAAHTERIARNPLLRNLHLHPELVAPVLSLKPREAKVCALVVEGHTTRKIASRLRVSPWTVVKDIKTAATALCAAEPHACRALPRQTVVAYYRTLAGSTEPEELFQTPA